MTTTYSGPYAPLTDCDDCGCPADHRPGECRSDDGWVMIAGRWYHEDRS